MAQTKFEKELISLLHRYIDDPKDESFNGAFSLNGAKLKTRNPKTIENFLKWLELKP